MTLSGIFAANVPGLDFLPSPPSRETATFPGAVTLQKPIRPQQTPSSTHSVVILIDTSNAAAHAISDDGKTAFTHAASTAKSIGSSNYRSITNSAINSTIDLQTS
jgi:hypothetical protein